MARMCSAWGVEDGLTGENEMGLRREKDGNGKTQMAAWVV
jgi:hypothetical protein